MLMGLAAPISIILIYFAQLLYSKDVTMNGFIWQKKKSGLQFDTYTPISFKLGMIMPWASVHLCASISYLDLHSRPQGYKKANKICFAKSSHSVDEV